MALTSPLQSCHGRWCSIDSSPDPNTGYPDAAQCKNSSSWFTPGNYDITYQMTITACCKIYCNTSNALDALRCQGASEKAAISIWICLMGVDVLAFLHLLGSIWPGLSLKLGITTMGNVALKTGLTSYFLVIFSGDNLDTILYPIVAAMDFAIFSYFFSGFQYSVGIGTEVAAVVLLSFTIFPLYSILTLPESIVPALISETPDSDPHAKAIRREALVMLSLALLWALHSAVYRTISYRAHWIAAWRKQKGAADAGSHDLEVTTGKHYMSTLWFLAAGQGHPTWHTSVGRSIGLLMLILAWIIVVQCCLYLAQTCRDDFILFQIMLYVPPVLLSLAMLSTEIHLLRFAGFDAMTAGGLERQGFWTVFKRIFSFHKGPSPDDFIKATVAYKLGRNSLYVEPEFNADFEELFDKCVGHTVCKLQLGLGLLFYIPNVIIKSFNVCILLLLCTFSTICFHSNTVNRRLDFEEWLSRKKPSPKEKVRAYETLIKCCGPTDSTPKGKAKQYEQHEKQKSIEAIFEKDLKLVNLPLLLDGSGPSALLYLLIILDEKLEATTSLHELQSNVNAP